MHPRALPVLVFAATALALPGMARAAEPSKPRFAIDSARDGFMRLDTQTGAVTHCSATTGKWTCDGILAADANLGGRVDALAVEVARLAANTAALTARVEQLAKNRAAAQPSPGAQSVATEAPQHVARKSIADRIVGRFLAMVRLLKHGKREVMPAATPS